MSPTTYLGHVLVVNMPADPHWCIGEYVTHPTVYKVPQILTEATGTRFTKELTTTSKFDYVHYFLIR
jgi:hypothetical protein